MSSPDLSLFLPTLSAGGAPRMLIHVAEALDDRGYHVEFVLARAEGEFLTHLRDGIDIVDLDSRILRSVPRLRRYLVRTEPAVLLSTTHAGNLAAIWATTLARVPTRHVVREPTTLSNQAQEFTTTKDRMIPFLVRHSYPLANQFIAISKGVKHELVDYIGIDAIDIEVIYNPVVTSEIESKSRAQVEHPWFTDDVPVILGAGRLTPQKDFPTLIRAFDRVRNDRDCRLMILGEGDDRTELETLVAERDLEADVALPGYIDNPYRYMRQAAVFVLSSAWEGFGNVLVEAMACKTPVVATDCESGPAEILEGGQYGRLVPVGNQDKLATAIRATLDDPPDARKLRRRTEDFHIDTICPAYETVLFGEGKANPGQ